jgi:hypothetical protein
LWDIENFTLIPLKQLIQALRLKKCLVGHVCPKEFWLAPSPSGHTQLRECLCKSFEARFSPFLKGLLELDRFQVKETARWCQLLEDLNPKKASVFKSYFNFSKGSSTESVSFFLAFLLRLKEFRLWANSQSKQKQALLLSQEMENGLASFNDAWGSSYYSMQIQMIRQMLPTLAWMGVMGPRVWSWPDLLTQVQTHPKGLRSIPLVDSDSFVLLDFKGESLPFLGIDNQKLQLIEYLLGMIYSSNSKLIVNSKQVLFASSSQAPVAGTAFKRWVRPENSSFSMEQCIGEGNFLKLMEVLFRF